MVTCWQYGNIGHWELAKPGENKLTDELQEKKRRKAHNLASRVNC